MTDTDRIVESQRQEAHKTRVLLVWLIVGLPACGLAVWLLVIGGIALSHQAWGPSTTQQPEVTTTTTPGATPTFSKGDKCTYHPDMPEWSQYTC